MKQDNLSFYESGEIGGSVAIISVPLELGSDERGLAAAPTYLFDHGLKGVITAIGRDVSQASYISCPRPPGQASAGTMKNVREIASVGKRTAERVERAAQKGDTVVVLGGDHSVSLGSIAGAASALPSLGVIYIDAHPDCNTLETSISGNVHGMVTSALMGEGHELLQIGRRALSPEHFVYVGLKDIDAAEIEYLRSRSVSSVTMLDIATHGLSPAIGAISALSRKVQKVWISMDLDSIDESDAPGVALSTPGGLTRREVLSLAHHIGKTCDVAGFDIIEMLPAKDKDSKTATLALEITARFLGGEYTWYNNYMDQYRQMNITKSEEVVPVSRKNK